MANRDGKLILRTLKNISASISVGGGGGTKVVTELPEVGEEHTIYELHQEKPTDFPWLLTEFDRTGIYPMPDYPVIVVETEEQVTQEYLAFHDGYSSVIVFVKNTSNVYACHIEHLEDDDSFVKNIVLPEEHSLYNNIAILKDFDYHITPTRRPAIILDGTGHFLDGTEFNYENGSNVIPLVLTEAKNPIILNDTFLIGDFNCKNISDTSELPTAKQAVDGNMCNSDGFVMYPTYISLQNKLGYINKTSTDTYSWNNTLQYFVDLEVEEVPENPAQYTGELEWNTDPLLVVNKIDLSLDLGKRNVYIFAPQSAHTEVTYWIYTNDEWVNMDKITNYTTNQIFVQTIGDYTDRPDKTITLVELDTSTEEPSVISEVPYKIIDEEHIIFYNVPYNKTLYICIDESLVDTETSIDSWDFEVAYYRTINNKLYYDFDIETIGGSIKISGAME